jgi:hypothetical protein
MGPNTQVRPRHCVVCQARNLFDGLDLPTPPELLDKYTKHPTLSQRQYQEELNKDSEDT